MCNRQSFLHGHHALVPVMRAPEPVIARLRRRELEHLCIGRRSEDQGYFVLRVPADEQDVAARDIAQLPEGQADGNAGLDGEMARRIATARDDQDDLLDALRIDGDLLDRRQPSTSAAISSGDLVASGTGTSPSRPGPSILKAASPWAVQ